MTTTTNFPNGITTGGAVVVDGATITVGAEAGDTINVDVQATSGGVAIESAAVLTVYLSDDSGGDGITAAAPDADVAVGTDGTILYEPVTDSVFVVRSAADGSFDLDIGDATGTPTFYLVVVLPGGGTVVSDAITFA